MKKIILPILAMVFAVSCSPDSKELKKDEIKKIRNHFFLKVESNLELNKIQKTIADIDTIYSVEKLPDKISNAYKIYSFKSLLEASDFITSTGIDTVIDNYQIIKDSVRYKNVLENFYFLRQYLDRPAVYKYNLRSEKISLVWQKWGRKIIKFLEYPENENAFFLTRFRYSNKGSLPLYTDLKLYKLNKLKDEISFISDFGKVFDYDLRLKNENIYLILNNIDTNKTSVIENRVYRFSLEGELIDKKNKVYHLSKVDELLTVKDSLQLVSPTGKYFIEMKGDSLITFDINNNEPLKLSGDLKSIIDIKWNEPYLLVALGNDNLPGKSFYIYDLKKKDIVFFETTNFDSEYKFWGSLFAYEVMEKNKIKINFFNLRQTNKFASIDLKEKIGISDLEY